MIWIIAGAAFVAGLLVDSLVSGRQVRQLLQIGKDAVAAIDKWRSVADRWERMYHAVSRQRDEVLDMLRSRE